MFGEGVNRLGSIGSSVIVGRMVAVKVCVGVLVISGVPVGGVVVGACVFSTNKFGVNVGCNENGVAVGGGGLVGVGDWRNGIETGSEAQPARRETITATKNNFFMNHLSGHWTMAPNAAASPVRGCL